MSRGNASSTDNNTAQVFISVNEKFIVLYIFFTDETISVETGPEYQFVTHFDVLDRYDITFDVLGCSNAHIALSATPKVLDVATYDVAIGVSDNTMCSINDAIFGVSLNTGECFLNCTSQVIAN